MTSLLLMTRYIDDIFMTTNETINDIKKEIERTAHKDVNIRISYRISRLVDFLDICIKNEKGRLTTTIYPKPAAEPYILPFTSDHPRHVQRNIPYGALLRAIRICSNLRDFETELIRIDLSLLLNSYPPNFIRKQFHRLLHPKEKPFATTSMTVDIYSQMHRTLLNQPTRRETQLHRMIQNPIEFPLVLQPKVWDRKVMYPRYLFESGLTVAITKQFLNWWHEYYAYPGSSVYDVKVRLVANTNRTLETYFIHKKPPRDMLTKKET